jgi:hypothetical protein
MSIALLVEAFAETLVTVPAVIRSAIGSGRHRQGKRPAAAPAQDRSQRDPARDQWVRNQPQSPPGFPPDARPAEQKQDAPAGPGQRRNGEMTRQVSAADARDQRAMGGAAPPGKMPPNGYPRPAAPAQDRSQRDQPGGEERREDPAGTRRPPAALSSDVPMATPGLGFNRRWWPASAAD